MLEQMAPQPGCGCFQALPDRSGPSAFALTLKADWPVFEPSSLAESYCASGIQVAQALKVSRDRWVRVGCGEVWGRDGPAEEGQGYNSGGGGPAQSRRLKR